MDRSALRIVTFCPPALAIQDMGPEASTLPPPVTLPGLKISGYLAPFLAFTDTCCADGTFAATCALVLRPQWGPVFWRVKMRKIIACAALAGAMLVSACNTIEGMGRDVSSAGDTVAKAADNAK